MLVRGVLWGRSGGRTPRTELRHRGVPRQVSPPSCRRRDARSTRRCCDKFGGRNSNPLTCFQYWICIPIRRRAAAHGPNLILRRRLILPTGSRRSGRAWRSRSGPVGGRATSPGVTRPRGQAGVPPADLYIRLERARLSLSDSHLLHRSLARNRTLALP